MAYNTPNIGNGLLNREGANSLEVGSRQWFEWLNDPANRSFYFKEGYYTFTARKERRQGSLYWYAYRRYEGKLRSAYIGKTEELELTRLLEIAHNLINTDRRAVPQAVVGLQFRLAANLISTKLHPPPTRRQALLRSRLTAKLDRLLQPDGCRLVLITAPAGSGKTTLLSDWLARHKLATAWLSLETADDEPSRFWNYLVAALNTLLDGIGGSDEWLPAYAGATVRLEAFLTEMINRLANLIESDQLLVLDDYHLLHHEAILNGLTFLLDHLPPRLHLVIISRSQPLLPLARLRARNELIEIEAADMRFTRGESAAFLNGVLGLALNEEAVKVVEDRIEGWAVGLQLAGLWLQSRQAEGLADDLTALNHTHRFVLDYLAEEVLALQTTDVQDFLLETAILESLNADLGQAVTGREDCQAMLERLEHSNLFVTPLDGTHQWYRYHPLFAEFLVAHLQRTAPAKLPTLHQQAAAWYERHGRIGEAIRQLVAGEATEQAAGLLESHSEELLMRGEEATLTRWMAFLPIELVKTRPLLSVHYAWTLLATDQFERIEDLLLQAERGIGINLSEEVTFPPNPLPTSPRRVKSQNILAEIVALRASVASSQRDVARTIELSQQALELLPQRHRLRGVVGLNLGYAYFLNGNLNGASETFAEASRQAQASGDLSSHIVAANQLAVLNVRRGQLHEAARLYEGVLRLATNPDGLPMPNADGVYLNLAMLLYEWDELDKCTAHLLKSLEITQQTGNLEIQLEIQVLLARVAQAQGRPSEVELHWQKIDEILLGYNIPWYIYSLRARRARLDLVQGKLAAASQWAAEVGLSEDDQTEALNKRAVEYIVLASLLIAQGRLDAAHQLLKRLLEAAQVGGYKSREIWIVALQARAYAAQGQPETALATLEIALKLAEPEGYLRVFADEGPSMSELLTAYKARLGPITHVASVYLQRLSQTMGLPKDRAIRLSPRPVEPLSRRELQVLRLLATTKSNAAIAQELTLTAGTVKIHAKNIYKKLDVHGRRQAVARAKAASLL